MKKILLILYLCNIMWSIDYETDIQPIFNQNCMGCHAGPYSGGLQLGSYSELMAGGNSGTSVIPYDSENSILYQKISGNQVLGNQMPPANLMYISNIDLIAQWIDEGALEASSSLSINDVSLSTNFKLNKVFPNPFNPITNINYTLSQKSKIRLDIYNNSGEKIVTLKDGIEYAGSHSILWNAMDYPSGLYFLRIEAENFRETYKLMLVK